MVRLDEHYKIEKTFSVQIRRSTDLPVSYLKQLFSKNGFTSHAGIAVTLPNTKVFFRRLDSDISEISSSDNQNKSAISQQFPVQTDELIVQLIQNKKLENNPNVAAATTKSSLRELSNILDKASITPTQIEPAILAAYSSVSINYPQTAHGKSIIAQVDTNNLTIGIIENGSIVFVRNLPISSKKLVLEMFAEQVASVLNQEIAITWNRLYGAEIQKETPVYIVPSCSINKDIFSLLEQKLNCQAIFPDPSLSIQSSADCSIDSSICTAEGLALNLLTPNQSCGINFLQTNDLETDSTVKIRKNLVICAFLSTAIVILLVVGLFIQLSNLEKQNNSIKESMVDTFRKTVPDEKNIVDPLAQLEQRLKPMQTGFVKFDPASAGADKPMQILRDISLNSPDQQNITINNILLTAGSARLSGTSNSYNSVYDWQHKLKENPKFPSVEIVEIGPDSQNTAVKFVILISLESMEKI